MADCERPGKIPNGKVTFYSGATLGNRIYYSCDEGYIRNGSWYRICESTGSWSGSEPTCEGQTPSQHMYNIAIYIHSTDRKY